MPQAVYMAFFVDMSYDQHFKSVTPHALGIPDSDLVRLLRRDFTFGERLIPVKAGYPTGLAPRPFGLHEFFSSLLRVGRTADAGDKKTPVCLLVPCGVSHYLANLLLRVGSSSAVCLLRIGRVLQHGGRSAGHLPQRCGRHYCSLAKASANVRSMLPTA